VKPYSYYSHAIVVMANNKIQASIGVEKQTRMAYRLLTGSGIHQIPGREALRWVFCFASFPIFNKDQ